MLFYFFFHFVSVILSLFKTSSVCSNSGFSNFWALIAIFVLFRFVRLILNKEQKEVNHTPHTLSFITADIWHAIIHYFEPCIHVFHIVFSCKYSGNKKYIFVLNFFLVVSIRNLYNNNNTTTTTSNNDNKHIFYT